jgi:hypothetical protein
MSARLAWTLCVPRCDIGSHRPPSKRRRGTLGELVMPRFGISLHWNEVYCDKVGTCVIGRVIIGSIAWLRFRKVLRFIIPTDVLTCRVTGVDELPAFGCVIMLHQVAGLFSRTEGMWKGRGALLSRNVVTVHQILGYVSPLTGYQAACFDWLFLRAWECSELFICGPLFEISSIFMASFIFPYSWPVFRISMKKSVVPVSLRVHCMFFVSHDKSSAGLPYVFLSPNVALQLINATVWVFVFLRFNI